MGHRTCQKRMIQAAVFSGAYKATGFRTYILVCIITLNMTRCSWTGKTCFKMLLSFVGWLSFVECRTEKADSILTRVRFPRAAIFFVSLPPPPPPILPESAFSEDPVCRPMHQHNYYVCTLNIPEAAAPLFGHSRILYTLVG